MKKNEFRSALNREMKHVRVDERLKRRIIAAAEEDKRRRQRKTLLRAISGLAAALVIMLGVTGLMLSRRPEIPDVQNQPLSRGTNTPEPEIICIEDPAAEEPSTPENIMVWATNGGKYYHAEEQCSGMLNARQMTLAEAMEMGKGACRSCNAPVYTSGSTTPPPEVNILAVPELIESSEAPQPTPEKTDLAAPEPTYTPAPEEWSDEEVILVWATQQGTYYHSEEHCSGMMNAGQITIETAIQWNKKSCPICRPPEMKAQETELTVFGYSGQDTLESLSVTSYGGMALLAEYELEQSLVLLGAPEDMDEWYKEEADMDTFSMNEVLKGRVSAEDRKLLEEEYFRNFEVGFAQNDVVIMSEDIATQYRKSVDPLPEGAEYHFRGADDPSRGVILYDLANDIPWTADHMTMTCNNKLYSWYFDGADIYSDSTFLSEWEYLRAPVQDGGRLTRWFSILDVQGNSVSATLWLMDDMKIMILETEDGTAVDLENTVFIDEEGREIIAPSLLLDPSMHGGNITGWVFEGDNMPGSGDSLVIGLPDGTNQSFDCGILEIGHRSDANETLMVWKMPGGNFYHAEENCSGMEDAVYAGIEDAVCVDLMEASFEGKLPCPVCNPPGYQVESDGSGMVYSFTHEEKETAADAPNLQLAARRYEGENGDVLLLGNGYEYGYEFVPDLADSASADWTETPVKKGFNEYALKTLSGRLEKQRINDWFRYQAEDPEIGILWDEIMVSAKDIDTQIVRVGNSAAAGMEYRFVDADDPGYRIVLYDLKSAYNPSGIEVNLINHKFGRYYDGENMGEYEGTLEFILNHRNDDEYGVRHYYLESSDIINNRSLQTTSLSPVSSGSVAPSEHTLEIGSARIQIRIWQMEDCTAIVLLPDTDITLSEDTRIINESREMMQPYMEIDSVWHPEWTGWIFQEAYPGEGDKLVISLEGGETREFDFGGLI